MKKLIIINGTMGVGKTTVSEIVSDKLKPSVFLDGDWCWKMNPWIITEENKKMVIDNITHLLNAYLNNSGFHYIIFCWVIHQECIFEQILSRLKKEYDLYKISLICSEDALRSHIMNDVKKGIRTIDQVEASAARLNLYQKMNTTKIDVSNMTASQAADQIIDRVR
ncbi:AAA family ATPase [Sporolactobacillus pectinivorans]|uniref:AAA family ATPase n=1 Tax=Sporolactobacillus pectinivorans TaxID=1591408 RepID=UPI000C264902|nr:AAA family ATPase [Sporolactobacillus pectinivorans]